MYGKLFLGLVAAVFIFGEASAQSGRKVSGSSYQRGGSSSKTSKQQMRFERDQKVKMVKRVVNEHFADIKLTRDQKNELKALVETNYQRLAQLETQMQGQLPQESLEDVRKAYKAALRKGHDESSAMSMGMQAASVPEMVQEKIMGLKDQSDVIFQEMADEIATLLDDEQKQVLMAKAEAEKKEMQGDQAMAEGEADGEAVMTKEDSPGQEMMDKDTMDGSASSKAEAMEKKEMASASS